MDKKSLLNFTVQFARKHKKFPTRDDYRAAGINDAHRKYYDSLDDLRKDISSRYSDLKELNPDHKQIQENLIEWGKSIVDKYGCLPTYQSFITTHKDQYHSIRSRFGSTQSFEMELRKRYPDSFDYVTLKELANDYEKKNFYRNRIKKSQVFIVMSAVTGCKVNKKALESARRYCELRKGSIIIMPSSDPAKKSNSMGAFELDRELMQETILLENIYLNSNLMLSKIKLSAKQIDATTGLTRLSQKTGTFIFASPKQRLRPVSVANQKHSRLLVTTGAITIPDYDTDRFMSERTAEIADYDHVMGGLIVEIVDSEKYHIRQFQFDRDGNFIDLGIEFSQKSHKKVKTLSVWPGDWHTGETCPVVKRQIKEIIEELKPEYFFLNDFFAGFSCNPHEASNKILKAQLGKIGHLSLDKELKMLGDELKELNSWGAKNIVVVKSNHDGFLENYFLRSGGFINREGMDYELGLKLSLAMIDNHNPLKYYVENIYGYKPTNVKWLKEDEDFILMGIQHGAHGHMGSGGKRNPSTAGLEEAFGKGNFGHSHSGEILRDTWRAGTSTPKRLPYVKGSCAWSNSHIVTYYNGSRQLVYTFDDYRLRKHIVKV